MKHVIKNTLLAAGLIAGSAVTSVAQDIYDDIYYNPDAAKKKAQTVVNVPANTSGSSRVVTSGNTLWISSGAERDIDEYNRRGIFATGNQQQAAATTSLADSLGDFAYTQRIERFYNPDVVVGSSDPTLAGLYYAQPAQEVNIYINDPGVYWGYAPSWSWGWGPSAYYRNPWSPYYGPYYGWGVGSPSWNLSWSLGWGWGWDFGWGFGPGWGWNWGWGGGYYPPYAPYPPVAGPVYHPNSNRHPGAFGRPNRPLPNPGTGVTRPGVNNNGQRPGAVATQPDVNRHPGNATVNPTVRPGSLSGGFRPGASSTVRPGSTITPSRPANNNNGTSLRPGATNNNNTVRPGNSNMTRPSNNNSNITVRPSNNTTRPSYQQSTPSVSRPSSTGGFRGGNSGGGNRGGGGGGRGRH